MTGKRPLLLDVFCGAGGCSVGYNRAGFDVIGIDIHPQNRYPFPFLQMNAMEALKTLVAGGTLDFDGRVVSLADIAVIHASPPCQAYSKTKSLTTKQHPDLVLPVRELLIASGKTYIIENVPGAPLRDAPLLLCGSMFGLRLRRHRYFENNAGLWIPPRHCTCSEMTTAHVPSRVCSFANGATAITVVGNGYITADGAMAMGIDWMTQRELSQAIPPAYTEYIGNMMNITEKQL